MQPDRLAAYCKSDDGDTLTRARHAARTASGVLVTARAQTWVWCNESAPDRVLLGNAAYEVAFSKTNGGKLYVLDKSGGRNVSTGSRNSCL